jgi:hypothetical protein
MSPWSLLLMALSVTCAAALGVPTPLQAQSAHELARPGAFVGGAATTPAKMRIRHAPPVVAPAERFPGTLVGPLLVQDRGETGSALVMLGLGGAGLVAGLLIGGEEGFTIASAGGVVGLVGLYRYFR